MSARMLAKLSPHCTGQQSVEASSPCPETISSKIALLPSRFSSFYSGSTKQFKGTHVVNRFDHGLQLSIPLPLFSLSYLIAAVNYQLIQRPPYYLAGGFGLGGRFSLPGSFVRVLAFVNRRQHNRRLAVFTVKSKC